MEIIRLPALSDNYVFLLHCPVRKIAAVVDPAEAAPVLRKLDEIDADLVTILNTHHHYDHVGGNQALIQKYPSLTVYGGEGDRGRIPGQKVFLKDGDRINFADREAQVLFVPGHTRAHIAYYFPPVDSQYGDLFCGDTLFAGGCGRLFEGTPEQMVNSLRKISSLPDDTCIWCAHEYTLKNLQFALTVETDNPDLQQRFDRVKQERSQGKATIPSSLGTEKLTNPFLRCSQATLQLAMKTSDTVETFARLRKSKDNY